MNHLDKVKLWGKAIRVMPSKHTTVQLPKDEQHAGLTKDYSNSNLHRFNCLVFNEMFTCPSRLTESHSHAFTK